MHVRMALTVCSLALAFAAPARAQVEEGVRRYEEADFRGALAAFDRALEAGVDRDGLARLLLYRAQLRFALGDEAEMMRDAARLAGVDPDYALDAAVPPQVKRAYDEAVELGAGLRLEASATRGEGGVHVHVRVEGDPGDLVRELRIAARRRTDPGWTRVSGETLFVPAPGGAAVEYYAEAIGPGGAILRSSGSEPAPLTDGEPAGATATPILDTEPTAGNDDADPPWLLIGAGIAGAVVAITIVVLIASSGGESDDTQLSAPTYR